MQKTILVIVITAIVMALLALIVGWCVLARKPTHCRLVQKEKTTTKKVVWLCLANGIGWVWCSYCLAWFGREQIAETLSQVAITEIIGVVLVYSIKSLVENLSKHNQWPDKTKPLDEPPENQGQG